MEPSSSCDTGSETSFVAATDEPRYSSAAQCIRISLLGESFGPEFTHQCFVGETIRGYQPYNYLDDNDKRHPSHRHHQDSTHELCIRVELSPSCQTCVVEIETRKKQRQILLVRGGRRSKRQKVAISTDDKVKDDKENEDDDDDDRFEPEEDGSDDDDDEEFTASGDDDDEDVVSAGKEEEEGPTRRRRMPVDEIRQQLSKALPKIVTEQQPDFLRRPLGKVVEEYSCKRQDFCLAVSDGKAVAEYHTQVQKLAIFFIETADEVDVSDDKEGFWSVLYLFRKHAANKYSLAGYVTLYHFPSPFRKPIPGTVVRVCQALILPPYQRSGHGRRMLHAVFQLPKETATGDPIVEINVEDPAPGFAAMRNRVDLERFLADKNGWFESIDIRDANFFEPLKETVAVEVATRARITPRQVHVVYELHKLQQLNDYVSTRNREEFEKKFRLMVKKRLNKQHREELGACRTKTEMQEMLSKLFDECFEQYRKILGSVGTQGPTVVVR